ncbi:hypothetical protein A9Q99_03135 [Gammaproteobacteria bacterium 45_16_T64]|nr:hypothetical protein A9Q99_03135 [Gammaproteobacteria bacterium 45_16_T64]
MVRTVSGFGWGLLFAFVFLRPAFALDVRIDGFASVVGGAVLDKGEGDIYYYDEEDVVFKPDSTYGIQLRADLEPNMSITTQIVGAGEKDYEAEFKWAFMSYQINDEWRISVGKTRVPLYMYSDFLDVGYAYHWIRPPRTVYELPFSTLEGINVEYLTDVGDWTSRLTLVAGATDDEVVELDSELATRNALGVAWSMNYDWFTVRAVFLSAKTSVPFVDDPDAEDLADLMATLSNAGTLLSSSAVATLFPAGVFDTYIGVEDDPNLSALVDDIEWVDDRGLYRGVAIAIDYDGYLFSAEYTQADIKDTFIPTLRSYYVSVGRRIGDWTAYFTFEVDDDRQVDSLVRDIEGSLPTYQRTGSVDGGAVDAALDAAAAGLNAGRQQMIDGVAAAVASLDLKKETRSIGVRWDFHPQAAVKAEFKAKYDDTNDVNPRLINVGLDLIF